METDKIDISRDSLKDKYSQFNLNMTSFKLIILNKKFTLFDLKGCDSVFEVNIVCKF